MSKKPCSICADPGDGAHFGAEACRACAAFFRRSVALQKQYACRSGGTCEIQASIRCMCRACRYEKCIAVGMRKTAVQRHRDMLGRREREEDGTFKMDPAGYPSVDLPFAADESRMPILMGMRENYKKMNDARRILHNQRGESIFKPRDPRAISYKEANAIHVNEMGLVCDFLLHSLKELDALEADQKKLLFRNFYLPFMLVESGYVCGMNGRTDIIFLPSGDYIDAAHPETFYKDEESAQTMSTEDAVRLFSPSFANYQRNIMEPMKDLKATDFEFFTLCSCILWDHGLQGQTKECEQVSLSVRSKVISELLFYHKYVQGEREPGLRLGKLFLLLPSLQRAVRRFQEDVEISKVFNAYTVEDKFYELTNSRF